MTDEYKKSDTIEEIECVELIVSKKDGKKETVTLSKITNIGWSLGTTVIEPKPGDEFVQHESSGEQTWTVTGKVVDKKGLYPK